MNNKCFWLSFSLMLLNSISANSAYQGNTVPVMLWSEEPFYTYNNPLQTIPKFQFMQTLEDKFSKSLPPIILFVIKDNFCIEDIKQHQESLQKLNHSGLISYFASVETPLSVFKSLSQYNVTYGNNIKSSIGLLDQVNNGVLTILQVSDFNAVHDLYNSLRGLTSNMVIAVTGKSCRFFFQERLKRNVFSLKKDSYLLVANESILFYADEFPSIKINKDAYFTLDNLSKYTVEKDNENYNLTMNFVKNEQNITLKAQFQNANGYFRLNGIEYKSNEIPELFLKSKNDIIFPYNFSYHCQKENIFFHKSSGSEVFLKLSNLQVQMDTENFGAVYDCIGFMSISIWTGLFVSTILAIIMIWGLLMILDIRTMDHFDDSKGKTISIGSQD